MPVLLIWIIEEAIALINSIIIHLAQLANLCERLEAGPIAVIAVETTSSEYLHR